MQKNMKNALLFTGFFLLLITGCAPKLVDYHLGKLKGPEAYGLASERAYREALKAGDKSEIVKHARSGIHYSKECLKQDPKKPICLYYNVLNSGLYIRHHVPNYQNTLKKMVQNCKALNNLDPSYQYGGCYRILGNIYAQAPAFSLNERAVTRDLDKSQELLEQAVAIAPQYALNHLFLARTLEWNGEGERARDELEKFDSLITPDLDKQYPEWKKERDSLARKLQLAK